MWKLWNIRTSASLSGMLVARTRYFFFFFSFCFSYLYLYIDVVMKCLLTITFERESIISDTSNFGW